jgi:tetratricopeptide (TPR) repeat protein
LDLDWMSEYTKKSRDMAGERRKKRAEQIKKRGRARRKKKELSELYRREGRWVLAIMALALLLRVVYLLQAREHLFYNELADSLYYHQWAEHIIRGQLWSPVFYMGPLYPHLLAFFYVIFGPHPEAVLWFQVLLGTVSCGLIYLLGRMTFGHIVGLLAASMGALYVVEIFYEGLLLMAITLYTLNLLMLLSIIWAFRRKGWYLWTVPGLLLGLSALGRANVLFFLPFLILGIFLLARGHGQREIRPGAAILAVLLGLFLVIAPVAVRNVVVGGDLVFITSNLGLNFFVGNNPVGQGYYEAPKGLALSSDYSGSKIAEILMGKELKPSGVSRFWLQRALAFVRTQPGAFLRLTANKLLLFWNAYEIPQAENLYFFERFASMLKLPWLRFSILGPLGLLGMALSLKHWRRMYFLLAFIFSMMCATVLFYVLARLRLQVCSVLMVFAGYALTWMWQRLRARKIRQLVVAILGLVPLALLVNAEHPALNSTKDLAKSHTSLARYLSRQQNDLQGAFRECHMAKEIYPQLGNTYLCLADLNVAQGRGEEAVDLWRRTLQIDPQQSFVHFNLGNLYAQAGMREQAIAEYRAEVEVSPYYWRAYQTLSDALREKEMLESGREAESDSSSFR